MHCVVHTVDELLASMVRRWCR